MMFLNGVPETTQLRGRLLGRFLASIENDDTRIVLEQFDVNADQASLEGPRDVETSMTTMPLLASVRAQPLVRLDVIGGGPPMLELLGLLHSSRQNATRTRLMHVTPRPPIFTRSSM